MKYRHIVLNITVLLSLTVPFNSSMTQLC